MNPDGLESEDENAVFGEDCWEAVDQNGGSLTTITNREWGLREGTWERRRTKRPRMSGAFNLILIEGFSFCFRNWSSFPETTNDV